MLNRRDRETLASSRRSASLRFSTVRGAADCEQLLDAIQDLGRDARLGLQRQRLRTVGTDDRDRVACRRRSRHRARDTSLATIRSTCFRSRFAVARATTCSVSAANPTSSGPPPVATRRRPSSPRMSGVLFSTQRQRLAALRHLLRARARPACSRPPPPPSRRRPCPSARADHGRVHLGGAPHADDLAHRRRVDRRRPGDERDLRAPPRRFGRNREPHPAARSVADDSAPDRDPRRSGPAVTRTRCPRSGPSGRRMRFGRGDDVVGLGQPPLADPAARQVALARLDEPRRRAPRACRGSCAPPRARTSACSSPARSAPARASPCTASTGNRRRCRWRACR